MLRPIDYPYVSQDTQALFRAIDRRDTVAVEQLLIQARRSLDINARDEKGMTPLHRAVEKAHVGIVTMLLNDSSLDVNATTPQGLTPLNFLVGRLDPQRNKSVVVILDALLKCPDVDVNRASLRGVSPLHVSILEHDETTLERLLSHPEIDANVRQIDGETPLHYAVMIDRPVIVQKLLEKGGDPTQRNHQGETPLDKAKAKPESYNENRWIDLIRISHTLQERDRLQHDHRCLPGKTVKRTGRL